MEGQWRKIVKQKRKTFESILWELLDPLTDTPFGMHVLVNPIYSRWYSVATALSSLQALNLKNYVDW